MKLLVAVAGFSVFLPQRSSRAAGLHQMNELLRTDRKHVLP